MQPPRFPRLLLSVAAERAERRFLLSDLEEEYAAVARQNGIAPARTWYWSQAVRSLTPLVVRRIRMRVRALLGLVSARSGSTVGGGSGGRRGLPVLREVRYAVRRLRRTPGFTVVAVLTLALGIGSTTAIFSVVKAVLLDPLPYPEPSELVTVWEVNVAQEGSPTWVSPPTFLDWREQNSAFAAIASMSAGNRVLTDGPVPERLQAMVVSSDFFDVLGVQPVHGRSFQREDELQDREPVVVVSHGFWRRWFGSDANAVGTALTLDGVRHRVIGVLPASFVFLRPADAFVPERFGEAERSEGMRGARYLEVLARLRPGVSMAMGQERMDQVARDLEVHPNSRGWGVSLKPLHEHVVEDYRFAIFLIVGAAGFVLLVVCANLATLISLRATKRIKELALRSALGASRFRILWQILIENTTLVALGCALGVIVAQLTLEPLIALAPYDLPQVRDVRMDLAVLFFAIGVAALTTVFLSLAGVQVALRADPSNLMRAPRTGGVSAHVVRSGLIVAEIAMSLVLLVGASLMARSFAHLRQVDPGFTSQDVVVVTIQLPGQRYGSVEAKASFYRELIDRLRAMDGVVSVGATTNLPLSGSSMRFPYAEEGPSMSYGDERRMAEYHAVAGAYFETMGIPLVRGRSFTPTEEAGTRPAVVINETLARRLWGEGDPIGRRVGVVSQTGPVVREVVGVIGAVRHRGLSEAGPEEVYVPMQSDPWSFARIVLRSSSGAQVLGAAAQARVSTLDPSLPVSSVESLTDVVDRWLAPLRFQTLMMVLFATSALVLAALGIYGVIAYSVGMRVHEFGVRVALGARTPDVVALVVRQGLVLAVMGVIVGGTVAASLTRLIRSILYEVGPHDPVVFLGGATLVVAIAILASMHPARRATRVDAVAALRSE